MNLEDYAADFEISKRYIDFSSELLRLSLLAITGICYLLFVSENFKVCDCDLDKFIVALTLFIISSCFALAHRFYATDALSYHIAFLRKQNPNQKAGLKRCLKMCNLYIIGCQYVFVVALCVSFWALLSSKY